jgi:hypothetical protein
MRSKMDRDADMYFEATKGKKGKKGANKLLPPKEDADNSGAGSKKAIKHTAESFSIFKQLAVQTPMTVGDLPELVEVLTGKLVAAEEKAKSWSDEIKAKKDALEKELKAAEATAA